MQPAQRTLALAAFMTFAALAGTASAAELVVTRGDDDVFAPQPGSLRAALDAAQPGDTITLNVASITLAGSLPISKSGLTIVGRPTRILAGAGQLVPGIDVAADGCGLRRLDVEGVPVTYSFGTVPLVGANVRGCSFRKGALLTLNAVKNGLVGGTKADRNQFDGGRLVLFGCVDTTVQGNTFRGVALGLEESESKGLTVAENTFDKSSMRLAPTGGTIRGNVLTSRDLDAIAVAHDPKTANSPSATLLVKGNKIRTGRDNDGISITGRGAVTVESNVVTGGGGSRGTGVLLDAGPDGTNLTGPSWDQKSVLGASLVWQNTVTAFATGIAVTSPGARDLRGDLTSNTVTRCSIDGIALRLGSAGAFAMHRNVVKSNGRGNVGAGLRVATTGATLDEYEDQFVSNSVGILVESASVDAARFYGPSVVHNRGDGMVFLPGAAGKVVGLIARLNQGAGLFVGEAATVASTQMEMSGNFGPGIDLAPRGVTPNDVLKTANDNAPWPTELRYLPTNGRIEGKATPGAAVEFFEVESGARKGNPKNGEGTKWLGSTVAGADGVFYGPDGDRRIACGTKGLAITCTATLLGVGGANAGVTSEFSPDFTCADEVFATLETDPVTPVVGKSTTVTVNIWNPSTTAAKNVRVQVSDGATPLIDRVVASVPGRSATDVLARVTPVSASVTFQEKGPRQVFIKVAGTLLEEDYYVTVTDRPTSPPPSTVPGVTVIWKVDGVRYATGDRLTRSHTNVTIFEITVSNASPTFTSPGPTLFLLNEMMAHSSGGGLLGPQNGFPTVGEIQWGSTLWEIGPGQVFRLTVGGTELGRILIDVE